MGRRNASPKSACRRLETYIRFEGGKTNGKDWSCLSLIDSPTFVARWDSLWNYLAASSPVPAGKASVSLYSMPSDGMQKTSWKSCAIIQ